jgi:ribosomal protein S18 acetylase RimI-like enzyme
MELTVRPLTAADIPTALDLLNRAFHEESLLLSGRGRMPFFGARLLDQRRATDPAGTLVAEQDGRLVGAIGSARWGSLAWFGPVGVDPALQRSGIGRALVTAWMDVQQARGARLLGLETYAQSGGHVRLYTALGFRPLWLSAALSHQVTDRAAMPAGIYRFSALPEAERRQALAALREMAHDVFPGLEWSTEVTGTLAAAAGDALLLAPGDRVLGGAVCQVDTLSPGPTLFISVAAVRPDPAAHTGFLRLLAGAEALAWELGRSRVVARVCTRYEAAYYALRAAGFRDEGTMLRLKRGDGADYERPDAFVLDSWL